MIDKEEKLKELIDNAKSKTREELIAELDEYGVKYKLKDSNIHNKSDGVVKDNINPWVKRIIGIMFLITGLYMVISNDYNEILMVILSVFSFGYWWNE